MVVIHLKNLFFDVLYQRTRTFIFFKFAVLHTGTLTGYRTRTYPS